MPKLPKDFSKSVIYRIVCRDLTIKDLYVGSTTNLTKRKLQHSSDCDNPNRIAYTYEVYAFIRANGGWKNWDIVMIEAFPCNNKDELHMRERYQIEKFGASLNMRLPIRTEAEEIKYKADWYAENRTRLREKGTLYSAAHTTEACERANLFYANNKDTINEARRQKIICECGRSTAKGRLTIHRKSKIHIDIMEAKSRPSTSIIDHIAETVNSETVAHDVTGDVIVIPTL